MKILTEKEYERRIRVAKADGFNEAEMKYYRQRDEDDFRRNQREVRDMTERRLYEIENRLGIQQEVRTGPAVTCNPF